MPTARRSRFQKPATSSAAAARLYSWGARALYLGQAFGLSAHRNAVASIAVGLDGGFGVKQLAARVDLQIRRVAEGSAKVADRLRRRAQR